MNRLANFTESFDLPFMSRPTSALVLILSDGEAASCKDPPPFLKFSAARPISRCSLSLLLVACASFLPPRYARLAPRRAALLLSVNSCSPAVFVWALVDSLLWLSKGAFFISETAFCFVASQTFFMAVLGALAAPSSSFGFSLFGFVLISFNYTPP